MQSKWTLRVVTALLWALAAASAVYWGLRMGGPGAGLVVAPSLAGDPAASGGARQASITRLLGATNSIAAGPISAPTISRFSLSGVVVQGHGGAALLVIDGKPPNPYRVGSRIDDGTILQSVGPRYAVLAASMDGAPGQRLELPPLGASKAPGIPTAGLRPPPTATPLSVN
jgi:general secretion pathway protein C